MIASTLSTARSLVTALLPRSMVAARTRCMKTMVPHCVEPLLPRLAEEDRAEFIQRMINLLLVGGSQHLSEAEWAQLITLLGHWTGALTPLEQEQTAAQSWRPPRREHNNEEWKMASFLSEAWIRKYQSRWNEDAELIRGLRRIDATMKYYVEGAERDAVFIRLRRGAAVDAGRASDRQYDYVMWASRDDWKEISSGALGPKRAMATRKLKFKGSMITAMRHLGPFGRSLKMMSEVKTEW